jgi:hypothetical protein
MVFEGSGLTRWGILNSLPYWGELKIHHLLDPMHIEGNVEKAIIKQLYGEKDNNFREACEDFERHPDVWITVDPNTGIEQQPLANFRNRIGEMQFPTCLNFDGKG